MIDIKKFSFSFNEKTVLENINFHVDGGEYISIIGPNGAGKSTLLKSLFRLHSSGSAKGSIYVKNSALESYSQKKLARIMAYVPQAGGWIPPFTVEELLKLSRYPHASSATGLGKSDFEAVNKALELTGLSRLSTRQLRQLSGGERQKAYIAAAVAQETEIILLDEPASFLDPKHVADLNHLLKELNKGQSLTIITVTHDLNHPLLMGGLALVLRQGEQLYFGPAQQVVENGILEKAYAHKFTYFTHPKTGLPAVMAE